LFSITLPKPALTEKPRQRPSPLKIAQEWLLVFRLINLSTEAPLKWAEKQDVMVLHLINLSDIPSNNQHVLF